MDAMTLILALAVVTAVIGQFLVVVVTRLQSERRDKVVAEQRARLVEAAADRQLQTSEQHFRKLDGKGGGDAY